MEFAVILLSLALLVSVEGAGEKSVASKLKLCKADDPNLDECFRDAVETAFRNLKDGDRSLGIVPIDPMFVPEMTMTRSEGPVGMTLKFINCTHSGLSNMKVISAKVSPDRLSFDLKMKLNLFTLSGPYETNGRILVLPIVGEGIANITMYDSDIAWTFQGKHVKRDGKTYLQIEKYIVDIKPKSAYMNLGNLFNGDAVLGETTNRFLNENSREVIQELAPELNAALAELHKGLAQRILDRLPMEEAFA
ncbi:protein takeout-like [Ischnura elegans]|uniref:protein takeout-like n=1 Tax=Ischnura elegans TaxID=197161 RepID=UPI001ED878D7|nr:protein takeout-like [Ischnura elegans]